MARDEIFKGMLDAMEATRKKDYEGNEAQREKDLQLQQQRLDLVLEAFAKNPDTNIGSDGRAKKIEPFIQDVPRGFIRQ